VYPDTYELGASNFGLRVVRHLLVQTGKYSVRRAFHPAPDMYRLLRENSFPWLDVECGEPVVNSDVIGFGISSEILFTNVLSLIDLMGLELRWRNRKETDPIILAGGGGLANPVPLMPFADLFFLGEAEAGLTDVMEILCSGGSKKEKLSLLKGIEGVLVPFLHDGSTVRWVRIPSLEMSTAPVRQIVPLAQITHDRAVVEASRGCTRGCRFCQASQLSRPVRERKPEEILDLLEQSVTATGWEKAGLLTLSFSDCSSLNELLQGIGPLEEKLHSKVSQPSLRPDTLPGLQSSRFFTGSLTMAPEAGTERLRRIINKPLTDHQITEAARIAARMGANGIKLYFMVGLPSETDEDLYAIASLADLIAGIMGKKRKVAVALSPFIPKPHTPFQWATQPDHEELKRRINIIRTACRKASVSWNDPAVSAVEHLLCTGGPGTADILEEAFRKGAVFDGWSDLFRWDVWMDLINRGKEQRLNPALGLPWDFIDTGVDRQWLRAEYERSVQGEILEDCRKAGCSGCGACSGDVPPLPVVISAGEVSKREPDEPPAVQCIRVRYAKRGLAVHTSHLDMVRMWTRTLRRSGLPLHYTSGYSRRVKLAFSQPIPLGMGSECEYLDLQLNEYVPLSVIMEALKKSLPGGIFIVGMAVLSGKYRSPDSATSAAEYIISGIDRPETAEQYLAEKGGVISFRICGKDEALLVSDPRKGASRPDRIMEAAGVSWRSIVRTNIYTAGEEGQLIPLMPADKGE